MKIIQVLLIALGLSMDAFAVAVTNGICNKGMKIKYTLMTAAAFGFFQGLMPLLGYALGQSFTKYISEYGNFVALILLGFIGGKMVFEGLRGGQQELKKISFGVIIFQGIATSIDALAVGVSFSAINTGILYPALTIAAVTFICSLAGVQIGKKFGSVFNKKSQIIGGLILIGIGLKIFFSA